MSEMIVVQFFWQGNPDVNTLVLRLNNIGLLNWQFILCCGFIYVIQAVKMRNIRLKKMTRLIVLSVYSSLEEKPW
jgi:hypothetical protein